MENEEQNKIIQKESIKLTRNTKGYNWEIKLLRGDSEDLEAFIERVASVDTKLMGRYGGSNDQV